MTVSGVLVEYWHSLVGSKINSGGELTIYDFEAEDYEELWSVLMEDIVVPSLKGRDYYDFLGDWAVRYLKARGRRKQFDELLLTYDPLTQTRPDELNTRQQLAIIKFFMKRRRYSGYKYAAEN